MKPFRFSLQAVRTLRQRQERLALSHYARAALAQQRALAALRSARDELESVWTRWQRELPNGPSAAALAQLQGYCRAVEERHRQLEREVETCARAVSQAWQTLQSARQQREVVDKYFERQWRGHQRSVQTAEQKMLDEFSTGSPGGGVAPEVNPGMN